MLRICGLNSLNGGCRECNGTRKCPSCGGSGTNPHEKKFKCPTCKGSGECPWRPEAKAIA